MLGTPELCLWLSGSILIILARGQAYFLCYKQCACLSRAVYYLIWHNLHNGFKHCEKWDYSVICWPKFNLGFSFSCLTLRHTGETLSCLPSSTICPDVQNKQTHKQWHKKITKWLFWLSLIKEKKKRKKKKSTSAKPNFSNTHLLLDSEQRANTLKGNEDRLSRH